MNTENERIPKNTVVLGSTGALGREVFELIKRPQSGFKVFALMGNENIPLLAEQCKETACEFAIVTDSSKRKRLAELMGGWKTGILLEEEALSLIRSGIVKTVVHTSSGLSGFKLAVEALLARARLIAAGKELLVSAGRLLRRYAEGSQAELIPLDSELTSLFILLNRRAANEGVESGVLTASGGPFLELPRDKFASITPAMAFAHPRWKMGKKISVDSASFMNKAFEVVVAHTLFALPLDSLKVVVHPEAEVHSILKTSATISALKSPPDMKIMIQSALNYPFIHPAMQIVSRFEEGNIFRFQKPDISRFPAFLLGYLSAEMGDSFPLALSAADEVFVEAFIQGKITFPKITELSAKALKFWRECDVSTVENIIAAHIAARRLAEDLLCDEGVTR